MERTYVFLLDKEILVRSTEEGVGGVDVLVVVEDGPLGSLRLHEGGPTACLLTHSSDSRVQPSTIAEALLQNLIANISPLIQPYFLVA